MNLPNDWTSYSAYCAKCKMATHASEGYSCDCNEDDSEVISATYVVKNSGRVVERVFKIIAGEASVTETPVYLTSMVIKSLTPRQRQRLARLTK